MIVFLSRLVSGAACGILLYRFLTIADSSSLQTWFEPFGQFCQDKCVYSFLLQIIHYYETNRLTFTLFIPFVFVTSYTFRACSWQNWAATWWVCAQRKHRSAWTSAQSDQSFRCALSGQFRTQAFFMRTMKSLIRLGGCPGWSESSLGAHSFCWFCNVAAQFLFRS